MALTIAGVAIVNTAPPPAAATEAVLSVGDA
jgi:hypothetical protein